MAQKKGVDYQRNLSYPQALALIKKQANRIAELEFEVNEEWAFNLQQFIDCSQIALHETFGFGSDRNRKFEEAMKRNCVKWMAMSVKEVRETEQGKGCEDFWVTQHKMDEDLKAAVGNCLPWEERYSYERLVHTFRDMRRYKDA